MFTCDSSTSLSGVVALLRHRSTLRKDEGVGSIHIGVTPLPTDRASTLSPLGGDECTYQTPTARPGGGGRVHMHAYARVCVSA